jgi:hypothetical protein
MTETKPSPLGKVITIDDERIRATSTAWYAAAWRRR